VYPRTAGGSILLLPETQVERPFCESPCASRAGSLQAHGRTRRERDRAQLEAENISKSYVGILRLALLPPDIVEAIVAGRTDQGMILEQLERPLPASWDEQRGACSAHARP
jgi:hypothetical protein